MYQLKRYLIIILLSLFAFAAKAQITGVVLDADTGDSIAYSSISYRGHHLAVVSDYAGKFSISKHIGWTLTISAVGYKHKTYIISEKTPNRLVIKLKPDSKVLEDVVVKSKKNKYSRKENPAVELMRRVIAARKQTKLENKDFYQYRNYEKMTIALNDISKHSLDSGVYARKEYLKNQVEINPVTGKAVLPVMTTEKVSHKYYRKDPEKERIYVDAEKTTGINDIIETGNIYNVIAKDVFTEIDIYDDQVRLLQYPFTSPIGRDAIGFYRFYIIDTVKVDRDSCIQVSFLPNNQQDFGFRGDLWILKDSTLHVKKVLLSIPQRSDVNFVKNMSIDQEYIKLPTGDWVLSVNDMLVEMVIVGKAGRFLITRTSRRNDYAFDPIDPKVFRGKALEKRDPYSEMRDDEYWTENREVERTKGEEGMDDFIKGIKSTKGFGWFITGLKVVMENYIETSKAGKPSKFDFGPITSSISRSDIDGLRLRISGQTTANLNPHLFFSGYYAHGFKSKRNYYNATVTYSFNKKMYTPDEFPISKISFSSSKDICSPSDKFLNVDKDNVFAMFKWSKVMNQSFYNRQILDFVHETDWGFGINAGMKFERQDAAGHLMYRRLNETIDPETGLLPDGTRGSIRTSEAYLQLTIIPGQAYINTKQRRMMINHDAPIFKLKHTIGINGFFGGQYKYHVTEASVYKRFWLKSWGRIDTYLKAGKQWNRAPFPLLIAPAANLSYIYQRETFVSINNMEFINDQYVSLLTEWSLNGKLFNRIPLIKNLQWRELIGFNVLYGSLTDKNNPYLPENAGSDKLMYFPEGSYLMDTNVPYMELRLGITNIFKVLSIEYVRRLNYLDLPTAHKHGVRFGFRLSF